MSTGQPFDAAHFRQAEHDNWEKLSSTYDSTGGEVTRQAAPHLLAAVQAGTGTRLLDLACGTGGISAAAALAGAQVTGLDFVAAMVAEARRLHPKIEFREGDAEALAFGDAAFDAVVCNFGIRHFADPGRAIGEAFRVLQPGGRFAFTDWCPPDGTRESLHQIVRDAVRAHGNPRVPMAIPMPPHDFSKEETSRDFLLGAGFQEPRQEVIALTGEFAQSEGILKNIHDSMARTSALIMAQTEEARLAIHKAILDAAEVHREGGAYRIPMPAAMNVANKPG